MALLGGYGDLHNPPTVVVQAQLVARRFPRRVHPIAIHRPLGIASGGPLLPHPALV